MMSVAPPLWQVDIQKRLGTEYWTNIYHCGRSNLAAAQAFADTIVVMERQLHMTDVVFVSYRVSPFPGPSEGTVTPLGVFGLQTQADYLPLFNVLRVDFPVTSGRPSRKYYRMPMAEANQVNGALTPAALTGFQAIVEPFITDPNASGWCDIDGQLITGIRIAPNVGMRQLRRGSKRRLQPVIPVG